MDSCMRHRRPSLLSVTPNAALRLQLPRSEAPVRYRLLMQKRLATVYAHWRPDPAGALALLALRVDLISSYAALLTFFAITRRL